MNFNMCVVKRKKNYLTYGINIDGEKFLYYIKCGWIMDIWQNTINNNYILAIRFGHIYFFIFILCCI